MRAANSYNTEIMKKNNLFKNRIVKMFSINRLLVKFILCIVVIAGVNFSVYGQIKKLKKVKKIIFTVESPENIPVERRVRELFPLRNYVFFDLDSTEISYRYVLLTKEQVKDFNENQLEVFKPKILSGRSDREMTVYYNILNILGNRMEKNPTSTIMLIGSDEKGLEEGIKMAESIKKYLVDVFSIDPTRIKTKAELINKPNSKHLISELDLKLIQEDNRRVSIESESPDLLIEFQSGSKAPLKAVALVAEQDAPIDSYVHFMVEGAEKYLSSWSMDIIDEQGAFYIFGPFIHEEVYVPGKLLLGKRLQGNFKVTLMGKTKRGKNIIEDTTIRIVLWMPEVNEEGMRYSVIYDFDDSNSSVIYEKYLTEVVTPKIPIGWKVILHGYSDIIGDFDYNEKLSLKRAQDAQQTIARALAKANRSDVVFEVFGFGSDASLAPFDNHFPEERCYNRSVIIDIIPSH